MTMIPNPKTTADLHAALRRFGFERHDTGGGCECFRRRVGTSEVWVTDTDDTAHLPVNADDLYVGARKAGDDDEGAWWHTYCDLRTLLLFVRMAT